MLGRQIVGLMLVTVLLCALEAPAQPARVRAAAAAAAGGAVTLPHTVADNTGNQWMIYQGGWLRQQGNRQVYAQGGMLMINGNQVAQNENRARLDESGELILENLPAAGINVTRRIQINREQGYVRYIDILSNSQGQEQTVAVMVQSNSNYGVQHAQMIQHPRRDQPIGWVGVTHGNASMLGVFGGPRSKTLPSLNWPQGNSFMQATFQLTVPAGGQVAIMHIHGVVAGAEQGVQFVQSLDERKLLADVPRAVRKLIVNYHTGDTYIGDYEILRGDMFDVVELRGGDQIRGTLRESAYTLETFYGEIALPAKSVIGLINTGGYRPRQLVVTSDGEIFGGQLQSDAIALELSSGQVTRIPLSQLSRAGYRRQENEPEEWSFNRPLVMMRSGDRVGVAMPAQPLQVMTRYGQLELDPQAIASVLFHTDDHGVHEVRLTDGSRFAGLAVVEVFDMTLDGAAPRQQASFPTASISRLQFHAMEDDQPDATAPLLELDNGDTFVGALSGRLELHTAFDTFTIDAGEIAGLAHLEGAPQDVQVRLWDQTVVSGQFQQHEVECILRSGVTVRVPVALIRKYEQPLPAPSPAMIETIRRVVAELNADDWQQRDRAEARLVSMGVPVISTLRELRRSQPPEAQQRIDTILKELEKQVGRGRGG